MSCKVIRPGELVEAAPIVWRHSGVGTPQGVRGPGPATNIQAAGVQAPAGNRGPGAAGNENVLAELERSAQARIDAALQRGRAEGEVTGAQRATQQLQPVITGFAQLSQELATQRPRLRAEAEESVVKLAIEIARRVLHRELATDPEAILGLVKAAAARLNVRETHKLRVAATDAALLAHRRHELDLPPGVEIVTDPSLPAGSAIFETSRGELDASVDTQLSEIDRGLADVMRRRAR